MGDLLTSFVGGQQAVGGTTVSDINPSEPSETVAIVDLADVSIAERANEAAADAWIGWSRTPAPGRGAILRRAATLLESRAEHIGRDLTREEGKTFAEGIGETRRAAAILNYYAGQTLGPHGETYPSHSASTFLYTKRETLGVVTIITPWNFPITIPARKIAPALAFGNTVCWEPAEIVPLTAIHLYQALVDAGLPAGVVNVVLGRGSSVGDTLVGSAKVAAVSFTGSNAVGQAIQSRVTSRGAKIQLELGGKNPAVVLRDANLEVAVEHIARSAFLSAGQKCTATSRVIVEETIVDEFTERLAGVATSWRLGDPLDPETTVGPVASEAQLTTISELLESARVDGGSFVAGGRRANELGEGFFIEPTVITDLAGNSRAAREEIFGPVAIISTASDLDEAIVASNDTPYGLTAAIFTTDLRSALRFVDGVRAGVVKVNQESAGLEFHVPFGGMKDSSNGSREQGKTARDSFTQWKTVYLDS